MTKPIPMHEPMYREGDRIVFVRSARATQLCGQWRDRPGSGPLPMDGVHTVRRTRWQNGEWQVETDVTAARLRFPFFAECYFAPEPPPGEEGYL